MKRFTMQSEIDWEYNFRELIATHVRVRNILGYYGLNIMTGNSKDKSMSFGSK